MALRMLRGVSPYLQDATEWLARMIESWGGSASIYSGYRSRDHQQELWDFCNERELGIPKMPRVPCPFPVATPGCSQHEYGFAVDVGFFGPAPYPKWNGYAQDLAREYWGLSTVAGDPNHFQMYPSSEFLPWVREWGDCRPLPRLSLAMWPARVGSRIDDYCGVGTFATRVQVDRSGFTCYGGHYG